MESRFTYIWEYRVAREYIEQFLRAYKPGGTWTQLFDDADGYIRTELYRDRSDDTRFVTIDYWESAAAWDDFRTKRSEAFDAVNSVCETYTLSEREIGRFEPVNVT